MLSQPSPVVPPLSSDGRLSNFSQIIQANMLALFQAGHIHTIMKTAPTKQDGSTGDIYLYDDGISIYLYIKTARGWARSSLFTLI